MPVPSKAASNKACLNTFTACTFCIGDLSRWAMVLDAVLSRSGLGLIWVIGAHGYRSYSSLAMAPMFKGIRCAIPFLWTFAV